MTITNEGDTVTEQEARDELSALTETPLAMLIWEGNGFRQFAIMGEANAHHSLTAARKEGARVVAVTEDGKVWGASQDIDRKGTENNA